VQRLLNHIAIKTISITLVVLAFFAFLPEAESQVVKDTLQEFQLKRKKQEHISDDARLQTFADGQKVTTIDSSLLQQYQLQQLSNLLAQQTNVFIKSYGLNGLATLNIRGSSAAQSQVLWNGVPVNNAALGMADVSLLPVSLMNKVHLVYGSSSALWGSGNVGGALVLESETPSFEHKNSYSLAAGTGSFGQYQGAGKLSLSNGRWSASTDVFVQTARNNFQYQNDYDETITTTNARLNGLAVQQQLAYKVDEKDQLRLVWWYQRYDREIPAALFESYSVKKREDASLRLLLDWNRRANNGNAIYVKTAFLQDAMQYEDVATLQDFSNEVFQYFAEAGWKKKWQQRHQILLFAPVQLSWMRQGDGIKSQKKLALAAAYHYNDLTEHFQGNVTMRTEYIDASAVLAPGIGATYAFTRSFSIRGNVQRTYRVPTLNELYYQPGGNPDLKPEQGWSEELGYKINTKLFKGLSVVHEVSVYNRMIDDWILWLGGAIWTPHNIASVHSRGIEVENLLSYPCRKWLFHLGINGSYTLATTVSSYLPNDGSIGKQIPYTPRLAAQINAGFKIAGFYFNVNETVTGSRYVNTDETGLIDPYYLTNFQSSYNFKLRQSNFFVSAQVNNILDRPYEVVKDRPMPGINWLLSLQWQGIF